MQDPTYTVRENDTTVVLTLAFNRVPFRHRLVWFLFPLCVLFGKRFRARI